MPGYFQAHKGNIVKDHVIKTESADNTTRVPFGFCWFLLVPFGSIWFLLVPFVSFWFLLVPLDYFLSLDLLVSFFFSYSEMCNW